MPPSFTSVLSGRDVCLIGHRGNVFCLIGTSGTQNLLRAEYIDRQVDC